MKTLIGFLPTLQIILSVLLIGIILIQQSEESLGSAFGGGSDASSTQKTRRGGEKIMFQSALVIAVLFVACSIAVFLTK
jgi:protein translocase SecG subunit